MSVELPQLRADDLRALELIETPIWLLEPMFVRQVWGNAAALEFWQASSTQEMRARDLAADMSAAARGRLEALARATAAGEVVREVHTFYPRGTASRVRVVCRGVQWGDAASPLILVEAQPLTPTENTRARRAADVVWAMPHGATLFDAAGRPVWENHAARCAFESRDDERPSLGSRFVDPEDEAEVGAALRVGREVTREVQLATSSGPRWHLLDARAMTDGSTGERVDLVVHADIHRWKTAELALREAKHTAEQANRSKSEFLANMSHEIRTPLNGVLGTLEMLARSSLDEAQRRRVDTIGRAARTLLAIIDDILDLSRIEAGRLPVDAVLFDLRESIEDVVELHRENAARGGLELTLELDPHLPDRVVGDPVRIAQVLGNLLGNAVKFTDTGGVTVRARCTEDAASEVVVCVEVSDTGAGIDAERLQAIFRPFVQADGSVTRKHGGTGLGLTISRRLVELLGGELSAESTPGEGSRFTFDVRLLRPDERGETHDIAPETSLDARTAWLLMPAGHGQTSLRVALETLGMRARAFTSVGALEAAAAVEPPPQVGIIDMSVDPATLARAARAVPLALGVSEAHPERPACLDAVLTGEIDERALFACLSRLIGERPPAPLPAPPSPTRPPRVLLVEDNALNREVAVAMLEHFGCAVRSVEDGAQAVEQVRAERFDLVLMDCQMPVMDGLSATRAIRELEAAGAPRTPIVALTANAMAQDQARCRNAGMDDFLAKPFEMDALEATVHAWAAAHHGETPGSPGADDDSRST